MTALVSLLFITIMPIDCKHQFFRFYIIVTCEAYISFLKRSPGKFSNVLHKFDFGTNFD